MSPAELRATADRLRRGTRATQGLPLELTSDEPFQLVASLIRSETTGGGETSEDDHGRPKCLSCRPGRCGDLRCSSALTTRSTDWLQSQASTSSRATTRGSGSASTESRGSTGSRHTPACSPTGRWRSGSTGRNSREGALAERDSDWRAQPTH
jgi:hypothetical protein